LSTETNVRPGRQQGAVRGEHPGGVQPAGPPRAQGDVGDVPVVIRVAAVARADPDLLDVVGAPHDALADQKARGQVKVVAGGPHGQRESLAADPDAQRLLRGEQVSPTVPGAGPRLALRRSMSCDGIRR
jgi:hypothetical protein